MTIAISVLTALTVVWLQDRKIKNRVTRISKSILRNQISRTTTSLSFPTSAFDYPILANQNPWTTSILSNTDYYDGMLGPDSFFHLDENLRLPLFSLFSDIKEHNRILTELYRLGEQYTLISDNRDEYLRLIKIKNHSLAELETRIISPSYKYIYELK